MQITLKATWSLNIVLSFPGGSLAKKWLPTGVTGDSGSIPGSGRFPWRRKWQPTPVFLHGKSRKQWSLVDYSPWGHKELDMTEKLSTQQSIHRIR